MGRLCAYSVCHSPAHASILCPILFAKLAINFVWFAWGKSASHWKSIVCLLPERCITQHIGRCKQLLIAHSFIHTKEKPLKCIHCDYGNCKCCHFSGAVDAVLKGMGLRIIKTYERLNGGILGIMWEGTSVIIWDTEREVLLYRESDFISRYYTEPQLTLRLYTDSTSPRRLVHLHKGGPSGQTYSNIPFPYKLSLTIHPKAVSSLTMPWREMKTMETRKQ